MYQVKIIEKICGKLAVNVYSFEKEGDMELFIEMCKDDKGIILLHRVKAA
ncbi:hypothetical protein [Paenibacillus tianjinensis]|uniref:Uncharacterized protein n=1 Tax=Paenibacillus tianjinensis TaxID=2810347 RepID=A0ABX7LBW8_9BACL|nr:hypothetical protein [Paenibacillus tianjinensis]QSF43487.1 hypothetical protein JRJ22_19680 [Paenibacillus tianjinensis]